jgi:polyribonucleotide nucleotidyltransferase
VNVASSDGASAAKAIQMINDLTAVPEVGKTYLGKVVRIAEFGAFVEIIPGTDGLLHISEIAEHRVRDVKDELKEGDQVLVKVLGIEGNRIKLSRKAILREQRAKMAASGNGGAAPSAEGGSSQPQPAGEQEGTVTFEGGGTFDENEEEPNFNREDANRETVSAGGGHERGGDRGDRGGDRGDRRGGRPHGGGRRHRRGPRGPRGDRGDRGPRRD